MSKRLEVLKASLEKKMALFDKKIKEYFEAANMANGQPMNDKRGGPAFFKKLENQNNSLRALQESIKKTELAIEKEEIKIANVEDFKVPVYIQKLLDDGTLTQWRRYPDRFFVKGVEKARIVLQKNGTIVAHYLRDIPNKDQYAIFRDVFNGLAAKIREEGFKNLKEESE